MKKVLEILLRVVIITAGFLFGWALMALITGCAVTPKAAMRHAAYSRLCSCMDYPGDVHVCLEDSKQFCLSHGLESDCGTDEFYGNYNRK